MSEVIVDAADAATPESSVAEEARGVKDVEWRRRKAAQVLKTREHRTLAADGVELRAQEDGSLTLEGIACRTGVSYDMGWYIETVESNAFRRTLGEAPDCQLLVNHAGLPLARTRSGTMALRETNEGLAVTASLDPDDPDVQSLQRKMARGDIDQMSFAFQVTDDSWNEDWTERTIRSVSIHRGDVSVVNQGASPTTHATIRSRALDALADTTPAELVTALVEWRDHTLLPVEQRAGKALSAGTMEVLSQVLNLIAAADEAVDEAQPLLAELMGVPNPDDDTAGSEADEPADSASRALPDFTMTARERERVAVLRARGAR